MKESPLRAGVVGVGALGRQHARLYQALPGAQLVGVLDADEARAAEVARLHSCRTFARLEDMLGEIDVATVAVPTRDHHRVGRALLEAGKDILLEKPMAATLEEADDLVGLAADRRAVLQIGHVERFNPATDVLLATVSKPRFIEVHRLASFSPRSLDIDVVLDLMIHDLDIVLALDASEPLQVEAVGVPVLTEKVDIANARLRFASGLIANLTASRVSLDKVRKFRVFSPHTYISVDFLTREAQVCRLQKGREGRTEISNEKTSASGEEPLRRQLEAFLRAVRDRSRPVVTGEDGRRALALAHVILSRVGETAEAR